MHKQAGDVPWPPAMIDECDMDIDIDITAEVWCRVVFLCLRPT